ncbi:MAG: hypothetical protein A3B25_01195 [Candidatus Ryanbacteria bacterium RIFCSPLOWO2_01_FULL_48_26]|uniref:Dienelactone hydrolase domain-containing protein n=1 Tax=Candidatus Ryanbacteria bacterium RIFCSPLOWO2_01_FULL_48_26 TaxID=1802126 RepID=A0A1G2GRK2_9BACT|nr:MAG: hypothetical protein A3B25_01195 [Candidatus Ryanbacteria bacterium RIFCSPLOWO2_01_FULL_48_26]
MSKILTIIVVVIVAVGVLAGGYFSFSPPIEQRADTPNDESSAAAIRGEEAAYYKDIKGYLATPGKNGTYPGIILIHEWWGLNDDIKELADRFANEGYVALAVDLYGGKIAANATSAREFSGEVRNNIDEAFSNLRAAVAFLRARSDVDKNRLASVGWCFGGGWSYQMAVNDLGVKGSVMYYGQFDPHDDFEHMRASILGHFGEKDTSITVDNVREFQAKLVTANGSHEVYIYPNVGHGFANSREGTNMAYSAEAAELAWTRTQEFLKKALEE